MSKWAYLVFPSVYSMLIYDRYTYIGLWCVETWLNIFPISKQPNRFIGRIMKYLNFEELIIIYRY